jgi:hypothetical protein
MLQSLLTGQLKEKPTYSVWCLYTVGASIFARTKIMACNPSGDDFIHLKTSHIKSRVILWNYSLFGSYSWKNMLTFFLSNEVLNFFVENFADFFKPLPSPIILTTETAFSWKAYTLLTSPTLLKVASSEKILSKKGTKLKNRKFRKNRYFY